MSEKGLEEIHGEELHQATRDRWASLVAAVITVVHALSGFVVFVWYYFLVPHWKHELDSVGYDYSSQAKLLIYQSDCVVNYWYMGAVFVPAARDGLASRSASGGQSWPVSVSRRSYCCTSRVVCIFWSRPSWISRST